MLTRDFPICCFGTYQKERVIRVAVLIEGLRQHGFPVTECQVSPGTDSSVRVKSLSNPWALTRFLYATLKAWIKLWVTARRIPTPKAVLVPYMGHFDVHLARLLFPRQILILDHLIFAAETASDRRANPLLAFLLSGIDALAVMVADVVIVDTEEHRLLVPERWRHKAVVAQVGAPSNWFALDATSPKPTQPDRSLKIVFFGLYIPLQGVQHIANAFLLLKEQGVPFQATMIGTGQDYESVRQILNGIDDVEWIDWLGLDELASELAGHDICLGIFGTSKKAWRVVPQKLFLGAAAGCGIVTSDTPPQRRCFGNAAVYAVAGDANALATQLRMLDKDRDRLIALKTASHNLAMAQFQPAQVTRNLAEHLVKNVRSNDRKCFHH